MSDLFKCRSRLARSISLSREVVSKSGLGCISMNEKRRLRAISNSLMDQSEVFMVPMTKRFGGTRSSELL